MTKMFGWNRSCPSNTHAAAETSFETIEPEVLPPERELLGKLRAIFSIVVVEAGNNPTFARRLSNALRAVDQRNGGI